GCGHSSRQREHRHKTRQASWQLPGPWWRERAFLDCKRSGEAVDSGNCYNDAGCFEEEPACLFSHGSYSASWPGLSAVRSSTGGVKALSWTSCWELWAQWSVVGYFKS